MSPASSGTLEVEKYIGACLISQTRPKVAREFYVRVPEVYPGSYVNFRRCNSVDGWAGGMPLISFATKRTKRQEDLKEESPNLARLAVHTQGAPLILTKTFNRRNKAKKLFECTKIPKCPVDAVSVASDESSGSANSDNCLPRIIKPRKRRKKDRKPRTQDDFASNPDLHIPPFFVVPDALPDESETPQLHHSFEDVEELEVDINGNQTLCQCRYCDPAGQIWDVDRSCYSPFLTAPRSFEFPGWSRALDSCLVHGMSEVSLDEGKSESRSLPVASGDLEVSTEIVTSLNGHRDIEIKFFSSSSVDGVRAVPKGPGRILSENDASVDDE